MVVNYDVPVPMRDGTVLRADIYRPARAGRYPVLLERVAYELRGRCAGSGNFYAQHGYVFVGQNVRGRFASGGVFDPFRDDGWGRHQDGYDSVEWAAAQPWSNGSVGMYGDSYAGFTQFLAAATRPPHLKTLFVWEGLGDLYHDLVYRGGAYNLAARQTWSVHQMLAAYQHSTAPPGGQAMRARLEEAIASLPAWHRHLPLKSFPPLSGIAPWYFAHLDHPTDGPYWQTTSLAQRYGEIDVPILHLGGWFDIFLQGTLERFAAIQAHGRSAACRQAQRLLIGPWTHGPGNAGLQEPDAPAYGPDATLDLHTYRRRWYDHWLKGVDTGILDEPAVRVFLMGANRWLTFATWPPPGLRHQPLYLHAGGGRSGASLNNGLLRWEPPAAEQPPDSYVYDPQEPVPSLLLQPNLAPRNHCQVEGRMLTYTTAPLERDLTVIGPVKAILYAASAAPDTDWVARLCDVPPDGRSLSICQGILRARYRDSLERPALLQPGQVYRFVVDLWSTAQVFQAGHRLRLEVTSSDFPRYDRNLNTGGPLYEETQGQVTVNTIYHDARQASHLLLPVL